MGSTGGVEDACVFFFCSPAGRFCRGSGVGETHLGAEGFEAVDVAVLGSTGDEIWVPRVGEFLETEGVVFEFDFVELWSEGGAGDQGGGGVGFGGDEFNGVDGFGVVGFEDGEGGAEVVGSADGERGVVAEGEG